MDRCMSTRDPTHNLESGDAIVDEVRRIRRCICERAQNDVDRLAAELREVEREYGARGGVFQHVNKEAAAQVLKSWGEEAFRTDDPLVDEVRARRKAVMEKDARE